MKYKHKTKLHYILNSKPNELSQGMAAKYCSSDDSWSYSNIKRGVSFSILISGAITLILFNDILNTGRVLTLLVGTCAAMLLDFLAF